MEKEAYKPPIVKKDRPNILFIIADQHRADINSWSKKIDPTPNLKRLADNGVRFNNMYCQYPICIPNRTSIITSHYLSTHHEIGYPKLAYKENPKFTLIHHLRDEEGYTTLFSGKTHMTLGGFIESIDINRLNDHLSNRKPPLEYNARLKAAENYATHYMKLNESNQKENLKYGAAIHPNWAVTNKAINKDYVPYGNVEQNKHLPADWHDENLFFEGMRHLLKTHTGKGPFFLWLSLLKPHTDWTPPGFTEGWVDYYGKYKTADLEFPENTGILDSLPLYLQELAYNYYAFNKLDYEKDIKTGVRAYYACVEYMDAVVGKALDLLAQNGQKDNTIVVYTTDHGEMMGHNGIFFKNCFYEPAVRVPCIISYPGVINKGMEIDLITEQIDIMPTLFDYAGIPFDNITYKDENQNEVKHEVQGQSMRQIIKECRRYRPIPAKYGRGSDENEKIEPPIEWKNEAYSEIMYFFKMCRANIDGVPYKYNVYPRLSAGLIKQKEFEEQLFNLDKDLPERNNLAGDPQYANIKEELKDRLRRKFTPDIFPWPAKSIDNDY